MAASALARLAAGDHGTDLDAVTVGDDLVLGHEIAAANHEMGFDEQVEVA